MSLTYQSGCSLPPLLVHAHARYSVLRPSVGNQLGIQAECRLANMDLLYT